MREFERHRAAWLQCGFETAAKVVDIRHMRKDIVAGDQIGLPSLGRESLAQRFAKKLTQHREALRLGRPRSAGGRLDAETRDARRNEILQQVTVVRGNLDYHTLFVEPEPARDVACIALGMCEPTRRRAGEIGVVGVEHVLGAGEILGLHEPAAVADPQAQRKVSFRFRQVVARQIGVRRRREAEVEKPMLKRRGAMTTLHSVTPSKSGSIGGWPASRSDISAIASGQAMASVASRGFNPPSAVAT